MTTIARRKGVRRPPRRLRSFKVGDHMLPSVTSLRAELLDMRDVLMGRVEPPIDAGVLTLMEVAEAYFSRACEIEQQIFTASKEGTATPGHKTFRTQELRSFKEMSKSATELGSRRLTVESLRFRQEMMGRESFGD